MSFAHATSPAILESPLRHKHYGRYSIFACDPVDVFIAGEKEAECPLRGFARRAARYPAMTLESKSVPFAGGWIGYFAYEAGLALEGLSSTGLSDLSLPLVRFCLYDSAAVFDNLTDRWFAVAVDWPANSALARPPVARRLADIRRRIESAEQTPLGEPPSITEPSLPCPNMSLEAYHAKVRRAKRYIEAGDVYQVNLTQRFTVRTGAAPIDLYRRLRRISPSPYAALLIWGDTAIISSSPELFLDLEDGEVITRPIKGTRPRGCDEAADRRYRRELAASEKDAAELAMIVDLLRNDLGRVCSFGSVRVVSPGRIETHPTVFHKVATIRGSLAENRSWLDLLMAAFPGGSITGAPKIRAMQIIDELEPTRRTAYCGSIGYLGLDGSMSLNIAIRTMVRSGDLVHVFAGGGIVADSRPGDEYDEVIAKARGMLAALGCEGQLPARTMSEVTAV